MIRFSLWSIYRTQIYNYYAIQDNTGIQFRCLQHFIFRIAHFKTTLDLYKTIKHTRNIKFNPFHWCWFNNTGLTNVVECVDSGGWVLGSWSDETRFVCDIVIGWWPTRDVRSNHYKIVKTIQENEAT